MFHHSVPLRVRYLCCKGVVSVRSQLLYKVHCTSQLKIKLSRPFDDLALGQWTFSPLRTLLVVGCKYSRSRQRSNFKRMSWALHVIAKGVVQSSGKVAKLKAV